VEEYRMTVAQKSLADRHSPLPPAPRQGGTVWEGINVRGYIEKMAQTLRAGRDRAACEQALAILRRWQFDDMLDAASRAAARTVAAEWGAWWDAPRSGGTEAVRRDD
jgi:hypothetical protein